MKTISSKTAVTLIELIVSSLLVAVVILGIFSVNMVLSNNNQDYGQRYLVKSQTQATLNHILNNAALASGSANLNDGAILIGAAVGDANSFCIHQAASNNLVGSANGIWLCYQWYPSTDGNYPDQIRWCAEKYAPDYGGATTDPRGASSCSSAPSGSIIPWSGNNTTFLGTAYTVPTATFTSTTAQTLISVTIQNCLNNNPSNPTPPGVCNGGGSGISSDPADNPEVQLSGSVIPLQVSS